MAELEELSDVAAGLGAPDLAVVAEDGEARHGEAKEGLELGYLPRGPSQQKVQLFSHLPLSPSSEYPPTGCRGFGAAWGSQAAGFVCIIIDASAFAFIVLKCGFLKAKDFPRFPTSATAASGYVVRC